MPPSGEDKSPCHVNDEPGARRTNEGDLPAGEVDLSHADYVYAGSARDSSDALAVQLGEALRARQTGGAGRRCMSGVYFRAQVHVSHHAHRSVTAIGKF